MLVVICHVVSTGNAEGRREMLWADDIDEIPTKGRQSTGAFRVDIAASRLYAGAYEQRCHSRQSYPVRTPLGDAMGWQYRCSENRVPRVYATRDGRAAFFSGRSAHHCLGVRKSDIASA